MPVPRRHREGGAVPWTAPRQESVLLDIPAWMDGARCTEVDPDLHFPEKNEGASTAKKICFKCEVRVTCLNWAIDNDEPFGILGGKTRRQRLKLASRKADSTEQAATIGATG